MSVQRVKEYFVENGIDKEILEFEQTTATVEDAARAIGCEPERIAKTISLWLNGNPILIVLYGDGKSHFPFLASLRRSAADI